MRTFLIELQAFDRPRTVHLMIPAESEEQARSLAQLSYPDLEIRAVWMREQPLRVEPPAERA